MEMMTTDEGRHERYVVTVQSPPRIVIADDEPDVLKLVSVALRVFGFDVVQAPDGIALLAEALGAPAAGRAKRRADVVVADVRMPGLSGLDVLALLRQDRLRTPMVLMSAYADGDTRACARALGADAFFAKPFDVDELVTTVLNLTPSPVGSRGE